MDEDRFNMSVRKFLKQVGVTSQRVIEEAVRHGFAVEHDAPEGEGAHGGGDGDEFGRPVAPVAGPQAHAIAVLERDDAIAVVLQFVQPGITGRHGSGEDRLARDDEAGRPKALRPNPAGRGAHQHGGALAPGD